MLVVISLTGAYAADKGAPPKVSAATATVAASPEFAQKVSATGFSTSRGSPASITWQASWWWNCVGAAMTTASTDVSAPSGRSACNSGSLAVRPASAAFEVA